MIKICRLHKIKKHERDCEQFIVQEFVLYIFENIYVFFFAQIRQCCFGSCFMFPCILKVFLYLYINISRYISNLLCNIPRVGASWLLYLSSSLSFLSISAVYVPCCSCFFFPAIRNICVISSYLLVYINMTLRSNLQAKTAGLKDMDIYNW